MTALMGTYGLPKATLVRGDGCYVWDEHGKRYLDLLAGIAVNTLGHNHPSLVAAVAGQIAQLGHVSNFFATPLQIQLAGRLAALIHPSARVFLCNSGTEAVEAAFKIARKTGRTKLVAARGSFHGRTMGALALTGQPAKQAPFAPLPGDVEFVEYGSEAALADAVDERTAAIVLEPVQGEGGVRPAPTGYLRAARSAADACGALLVIDEVQTGIGRTGSWLAYQKDSITPDVVTLAKGLGGGIPIGACIGVGRAGMLLGKGEHGSTFGGNPVACAAALAVLDTIERDGLVDQAARLGDYLLAGITRLGHHLIADVRGAGLLLAIGLTRPIAASVVDAALTTGFIVNDVAPDAIRLAPPLILTLAQADEFLAALPAILDMALSEPSPDMPRAGSGANAGKSVHRYEATAPLPARGAINEGTE